MLVYSCCCYRCRPLWVALGADSVVACPLGRAIRIIATVVSFALCRKRPTMIFT